MHPGSFTAIALERPAARPPAAPRPALIGVLEGEGIGPEVIGVALDVLGALGSTPATGASNGGLRFEIRRGGPIGHEAVARCGRPLSDEVAAFCAEVFAEGGAVLAGPGGGRFVYDLRRRFDLFLKISPVRPAPALAAVGCLKPAAVADVDVLVVREIASGLYQGQWSDERPPGGERVARHSFSYGEGEVRRFLRAAARLAARRRGQMAVIVKDGGAPSISALWRDCALEAARDSAVACAVVDVDLAAYRLVQSARDLDVVAAPNLVGDILSDLGGVLVGSRGLTYSGNFAASGAAVYQTNHGAAYDIAGADRANPAGQVLSLAFLLRESFGLHAEADRIEAALDHVWRSKVRTADIAEPGARIVGTREMGAAICEALGGIAGC